MAMSTGRSTDGGAAAGPRRRTAFSLLAGVVLVAAFCSFWAPGARAQLYQYTDGKGNVVFSDHPPQGSKATEKVLRDDAISWSSRGEADIPAPGDGKGGQREADEVRQQKPDYSSVTVIMYRTSWCGYCKQAAAYVRLLGAGLVEYDIDRDPDRKAEMRKKSGGSTAVPLIDIDGTIIRGYSPPAIRAAVARSAAR